MRRPIAINNVDEYISHMSFSDILLYGIKRILYSKVLLCTIIFTTTMPILVSGFAAAERNPGYSCAGSLDPAAQITCRDDDLTAASFRVAQAYYAVRGATDPSIWPTYKQRAVDFLKATIRTCEIPARGAVPLERMRLVKACMLNDMNQQRGHWIAELRRLGNADAVAEAEREPLEHVRQQQWLKDQGWLPADAEIDGIYGEGTRNAIRRMQASKGLPLTGFLAATTVPLAASPASSSQTPPAPSPQPVAVAIPFVPSQPTTPIVVPTAAASSPTPAVEPEVRTARDVSLWRDLTEDPRLAAGGGGGVASLLLLAYWLGARRGRQVASNLPGPKPQLATSLQPPHTPTSVAQPLRVASETRRESKDAAMAAKPVLTSEKVTLAPAPLPTRGADPSEQPAIPSEPTTVEGDPSCPTPTATRSAQVEVAPSGCANDVRTLNPPSSETAINHQRPLVELTSIESDIDQAATALSSEVAPKEGEEAKCWHCRETISAIELFCPLCAAEQRGVSNELQRSSTKDQASYIAPFSVPINTENTSITTSKIPDPDEMLSIGSRVTHATLGTGTIVDLDREPQIPIAIVHFDRNGWRRKLRITLIAAITSPTPQSEFQLPQHNGRSKSFSVGDHVQSQNYGWGVIKNLDLINETALVAFYRDDSVRLIGLKLLSKTPDWLSRSSGTPHYRRRPRSQNLPHAQKSNRLLLFGVIFFVGVVIYQMNLFDLQKTLFQHVYAPTAQSSGISQWGNLPPCPTNPAIIWTDCFGTKKFPGNDSYVGEFRGGKPHGQGKSSFPNGATYVGRYRDGEFDGYGTYTFPIGYGKIDYEGEFRNGMPNGHGSLKYTDGTMAVGEFRNGLPVRGDHFTTQLPGLRLNGRRAP